ncbi:hypothetical protein COLO4_30616 [Corchorus olitorius]|uniref:Cytochrome P450 n=1 Tax=Corchorus olitorius TaxID=93759 RepID=A0A1R3H7P1_9ROSI|nr:hypothetical protein COLO4_30616 [Corchorus olitorius]
MEISLQSYLVQILPKKLSTYGYTRVQHPPIPPGLPIIGHLHHLFLGSTSFPRKLHTLATRYGPLLQLHIGASRFILVSNANVAKEMLKTHELNFVDRPEFGNPDDNMYFGSGLIVAPYGTYWRFCKKLCMAKLLSTSKMNQFVNIREQEIMKLLQYLVNVSSKKEYCNLSSLITTMMNNVICRMAMSTSTSDEAEKIKELVEEMGDLAGKLSAGDILGPLKKLDLFGYGRKLKKALDKYDKLVEEIMKKHEENSVSGRQEGKDLMDDLMETCNDPSAEVKLTKTDIKAFLRVSSFL